MARGYIGADWLEDQDLPVSRQAWTNIQKRKTPIKGKDPRILEEAKWNAANPGLEWSRDVLNQAGQGWNTRFLPGARDDSIHKIAQLPEIRQAEIGFAQDYGGYMTPKQAALRQEFGKGIETVIDGAKETGAGAGMGGAAPGGTPWGLISAGLGFLSKLTDKSKKGQPGPQTAVGKGHLTSGLFDWQQFFRA